MKSVQVNNIQAFNEALKDETVGHIVLLNDLNGDITIQRKVNVDLNDFTLSGNLSMQHTENGTVTIGSGVITGDLSMDTPNATVINHADVNGQTTIEDVAENTFDNSGELHAVKFVDPNGGRLINRNSTAVGTLVIDSPASITLSGNFDMITVAQSMSFILEADAKIKEMQADQSVSVEIVASPTAVIEKKPEGFKLVDYSIETLNQQKLLRQEIVKLNALLSGDWNDEAFVESFIQQLQQAWDAFSKLPDTLETRRLGSDLSKLNSAYDNIPAASDLQQAFDDFVPTIREATSLNGASIEIPSLQDQGIYVYSASHDNIWDRFDIPARPNKEDEVRHILFSIIFQKGHKSLQRDFLIHIPYGTAEITFETLEPGDRPANSDYVTSDSFKFDPSNDSILFTEGLTVGDFLSSSLIPNLSTDYEVFSYMNHADSYVKESYDAVYDSDVISERLNVIQDEMISDEMTGYQEVTGGSFVFDIEKKELRYKGDIKVWDLQEALNSIEGESFGVLNFIDVHSPEVALASWMQLIHKESRGIRLFMSKNYEEPTPDM